MLTWKIMEASKVSVIYLYNVGLALQVGFDTLLKPLG